MLRTSLIASLLCWILVPAAFSADTTRVTSSFDARHAGAVLRQVSKALNGGFDRAAADKIAHDIDTMKADKPMTWQFQVKYRQSSGNLEIRALLDDLGMLDLDFTSYPEAIPAIRAAVDGYLNSHAH
jgi:hypothetical protein